MHWPQARQRCMSMRGAAGSSANSMAFSLQASTHASQAVHAASVIAGRLAAMMPISFIWGWEQAVGHSATVTRNS
jgi:hypothetical protein